MEKDSYAMQLVTGDGEFCSVDLENFIKSVDLHRCGLSYTIVAIMGPQCSGKSSLLNQLFYTNFEEMDAMKGRYETTKGIWIAKALGIEPLTIVMDLEGTDGRERGQDDTSFERQSALFALAVADVVIINMWCHDIGRHEAANNTLLRTVFQVMMRLITPRKTTLLFVIRDKTKTPLTCLEPVLRDDIQKIWETVRKPQAYKDTPLSEFFNVEVTALSSYEAELFQDEVAQLRKRFSHSISPGGLAGDRRGMVAGSGFSFGAEQIWKVIKENKDLDFPTYKVMVATVRCGRIADDKFSCLTFDKDWLALEQAVQTGVISGFEKTLSSILKRYLFEYDAEAIYFEEGVRNAKRQYLESKVLELVHPAYFTMLGHRLEKLLVKEEGRASFVRKCQLSSMLGFDQGCLDAELEQATWDASKAPEKLNCDIQAHSSLVRNQKLSELIAEHKRRLSAAINEPGESLFEAGGTDTWASKCETGLVVSDFSSAVHGFELDKGEVNEMVNTLKVYAKNLVEMKAREESGKVLIDMKDRFSTVFNRDNDSISSVWTGKEDIRTIKNEACVEMTLRRRSRRSQNFEV